MPFNILSLLVTQQNLLTLDYAGGSAGYDVENQLVATYGVSSTPAMIVIVTVTGDANAPSAAGFAIDGDGLDPAAILRINLVSVDVNAVGGSGGVGGNADYSFDPETGPSTTQNPGNPGLGGGSAIRMGCDTTIQGSGEVRAGFGGGGGGGGRAVTDLADAGGGGGGGAPSGLGGGGGLASGTSVTNNGSAGVNASETTLGAGGSAGGVAGDGGDGGYDATAAETGETPAGGAAGGVAGSDGFTVEQHGFTLIKEGSVTYVGSELS